MRFHFHRWSELRADSVGIKYQECEACHRRRYSAINVGIMG